VWASAWRFCGLVALQLLVGASVFLQRGSVALRTVHVALGALVLAQAVVLAWEALRRAALPWGRLADYLELTKPRLSSLVLMTTAVGFWLGMRTTAQLAMLLPVCLGTSLVVGGANALNQWMERGPDARMQRTRHRPLPSGRLAPEAAFRFGLGLSVGGLVLLATAVSMLSACLAAVAWAIYLLVYTPMKRWTPLCTLVGAIPGALPPVIGWAGARHALDAQAAALFAILFFWQLPHFLALAVLYRDDYARAGFPMLPLVEAGGVATARQTALYGMALVPVSLFPTLIGVAGAAYFYGAMALGLAFFVVAARSAWVRSPQSARQLFRASVCYLPLLLGLLAVDRVPLE
jgi:protoheme IX farnesyltransferase